MMWELLQITILGTNSKIVGTRTFRKFPYAELTLINMSSMVETYFIKPDFFVKNKMWELPLIPNAKNEL